VRILKDALHSKHAFDTQNPEHRYLIMQFIIKFADLGNSCRDFSVAAKLARKLGAEFDCQVRYLIVVFISDSGVCAHIHNI
jgi:hypothetical protein